MKRKKLLRVLLAATLVLALITPSLFYLPLGQVHAGSFTSASLTISDSRASGTSVTYNFGLTASVGTAIKQIDIYFCTTPTGTCTAPTGFNTGTPTLASDSISGTGRTTSKISAADNTARVVVTTPATQSPTNFTMSFTGVTNQSTINTSIYARTTSYSDTGTTEIDDIQVASAILATDSIYVTADVGSTFTFTVAAANSGTVNGASIDVTSTASTIPYGVLTMGTPKIAAHDVSIITNATNGYVVTVKSVADPPLTDASDNIDKFNQTNAAPTTWSEPAGTVASVNTGFFGYTTEDPTLGTGTAARFTSSGGNKWAGFETTAYEVIYNSVAPGGSGETTRLGWQTEVNTFHPPGTYSGSIILVATPTY